MTNRFETFVFCIFFRYLLLFVSIQHAAGDVIKKNDCNKFEETDKNFNNSEGTSIFRRYWPSAGTPRAIVFLCHGYAEHSGRYEQIATDMTSHGLMVFAHDHVGHGLSGGDRVDVDKFMTYVNDVIQDVQMIKDKHRHLPLFIYGHSMGGQIAVLAVIQRPDLFAGAVLEAPLIQFDPELMPNSTEILLAHGLAAACPQCPLQKQYPEYICSDPAVIKDIENDPLCWNGYTKARQSVTMLDTVIDTYEKHLTEVSLPFLVMHGDKDKLAYLHGSQKLYKVASSTDKTIKIYPGALHQLHSEPKIKVDVERRTVKWIKNRI